MDRRDPGDEVPGEVRGAKDVHPVGHTKAGHGCSLVVAGALGIQSLMACLPVGDLEAAGHAAAPGAGRPREPRAIAL